VRIVAAATLSMLALVLAPACASGASEAGGGEPPRGSTTSLRVSVWPEGRESGRAPTVRTLRCNPAGGTVRRPAEACRRLLALRAPFAPVPKGLACIEVYGGPEEALVSGTFRGRRVLARFSRTDGCQIRRWDRVAFVFAGVA
jgi:hypothetical protein